MGTTQRIGNGVKNEPNWGNLTSTITSIAKTKEEIKKLEKQDEELDDIDSNVEKKILITRKLEKLDLRENKHIKSSIERLVLIGGGRGNISSGKSNKFGRAGIKNSTKLITFFSILAKNDLKTTLSELDFELSQGKTTQDIIDFLAIYCSEENIGMDEAAANSAMYNLLKELQLEAEDDLNNLEKIMKAYLDKNKLSQILCVYFGNYIYEFLWERLEERLRQIRGEEISKSTFDSIKKEIGGRVQLLNENRLLAEIDWAGEEGRNEIEKIFDAILIIEE